MTCELFSLRVNGVLIMDMCILIVKQSSSGYLSYVKSILSVFIPLVNNLCCKEK